MTFIRFWRRRSFRTKLLLPMVGLMLASLLVSTVLFIANTTRLQDEILRQQTTTDAARVIEAFKARSAVVQAAATLLASDPRLPPALNSATPEALAQLTAQTELVRDRYLLEAVQLYDAQGTLRISSGLPYDPRYLPLLALVNSTAPVVRTGAGGIMLLSRAELPNRQGTVVTAILLSRELQRIMAQNRLTGDIGLNVDGIKISTHSGLPFEAPPGRSDTLFVHHVTFQLGDTLIPMVVTRPLAEINQMTTVALWIMGGSTVVTLLLLSLIGVLVTHSMAEPIQQLARAAQALLEPAEPARRFDRAAALLARHPPEGDEVGLLTQTFQTMLAELAELYTGLEQKVQQRTAELNRRAVQLETSIAVARQVTSLLEPEALLQAVVNLIQQQFQCYYVAIFLARGETFQLQAYARADQPEPPSSPATFSLDARQDPIFSQVLAERRAIRVDAIAPGDPLYQDLAPHTRAELALPLEVGGTLLGVLNIRSDQTAAFDDEEVPLLQSLADQVAIAIQNAARYQSEQTRRRLAETLYAIGQALSSTLNLAEVLELILSQLAELVPYDRGSVLLRQAELLQIVAARGFPADANPQAIQVIIRPGDVFDQVCRTRRPLVVLDAVHRPDWQQRPELPPAHAWLGVPLILQQEVLGMLSLVRETAAPYTEDEVTLATTFAGQAALALQNARLYEQVVQFNQRLEQTVQERTEALRTAYTRLQQLDRAKSDFITVLGHELRTPLTTISGYNQMLAADPTVQANPYHQQLVAGIRTGVERMQEIVNQVLDVIKVDSRALELEREPLSLYKLLRVLVRCFDAALQERHLTLTVEDFEALPPIEGDSDALRKVFQQLILNAIKYTPDGGRITISGRAVAAGEYELPEGGVEIVVSDTGIGIDAHAHELIFAKFFYTGQVLLHSSGKTKFKGGGPGLGLAIARGIVEAHHGRLWAESPGYDEERCPGSQFHVILPLRQPPVTTPP